MALDNFIPQVWAAQLLGNLRKNLVFAQPQVVNQNVQGEVKYGNTVFLNVPGAITVQDYTRYTDLASIQPVTTTKKTLLIDQAKAFAFEVDDIDRAQAAGDVMQAFMQEAAYAVRDAIDQYIASLWTGVDSGNVLGSDTAPESVTTGAQAYDLLVELGRILTEAKVPKGGRWAVLPPKYESLLYLSNSPLVKVDTTAGVMLNGQIGRMAGFDYLLVSHNYPQDGQGNDIVLAGTSSAWGFAMQVEKVEAFRPEKRFTDAVKGLTVYGAAMFFGDRIAAAHVKYE